MPDYSVFPGRKLDPLFHAPRSTHLGAKQELLCWFGRSFTLASPALHGSVQLQALGIPDRSYYMPINASNPQSCEAALHQQSTEHVQYMWHVSSIT